MNPVLLEFAEEIETERLTIRAPRYGDGPELRAAIEESLPALRPWMPWAAGELQDEAYHESLMRRARAKFLLREDLWMLLFLKGTNTMVGSSGLHRMDWVVPRFEIGYWVRTPYAGKGFITEAVKGIANFAIETLGARRLEIHCDANNERSAAVARRAGFEMEARLRQDERSHWTGELRDTLIFARIVTV
jgi:ribosomal-protein-serine acetyltransferase